MSRQTIYCCIRRVQRFARTAGVSFPDRKTPWRDQASKRPTQIPIFPMITTLLDENDIRVCRISISSVSACVLKRRCDLGASGHRVLFREGQDILAEDVGLSGMNWSRIHPVGWVFP